MNKSFRLTVLFLVTLSMTSLGLWAQIPDGYYDNASGKTGDELKTALHNIIKGHTVVSYNGLLDAFAYTDCKANGKIWDIYSDYEYSLSGNCGSYNDEGDCWNREHTWPQSWFNEKSTPRSDLFHVMPTDGYVNNRRSNYPYGEVNNATYTSENGSKLGSCKSSLGYSGTVFEPIDEYKGDIARNYFYMSVRYYGEDSGWGSSGMTNKSEIKDWAMDMLLRWSDQDPVSQKEIDRNNAVYGYQNNRNPFIDHPEYARMIWDENWSQGESYDITCATGLSHGSVSAPESAMEGTTVAITATPDAGYMVSTYSVYKTDSPNTTINVSSNGTFTMPAYDVTVSATFMQNNTYYNIALGTVSHGSISVSTNSALSGTNITLTATPESGYSLYAWYVYKTGDMNTTLDVSGNSFVMPAFDVTVMATFVQGNNGDYVKVTSAPTDWSGEYLIVYETGKKAFNGGLTELDVTSNTISVTINDNTITANTTTNAAKFTISAVEGGYSIQSASGYYIGQTYEDNGLKSSQTTVYVNTLSYNAGNIDIISSGGPYLRYNANSGQERFRYFKSSTYTDQKAIQLYKKTINTPTHIIHFDSNGGEGSMNDQTVTEYEPTALTANDFTKDDYLFADWNTEADGSGEYYVDGATVTLLNDLTLYAQWNQLFDITLVQADHGSISVNVYEAVAESTITLTATPGEGYELGNWVVTDAQNNIITVTENQFEMPANNVTVSASFIYVGEPYEQHYYLVTSTDQLEAGRTYLIVNTSAGKALGTTQNNNNRSAASVTINSNMISSIETDVCELTLGGENGAWTFFDALYNNNLGGYLYAASSSSNILKTKAELDDNGRWSIEINNSGKATIVAGGTNTRNHIRYNPNNSNPIFSCYDPTSDLEKVELYIRSEEYEHTNNTTLTCLNTFDKHIIHSGVTLTATSVLGMAMCNNANHLVIEDGAQFIHHVDGLQAVMKKSITAYNNDGGWYTIATPFTDFSPTGMNLTTANFDLYAYDEDADLEWRNYKANSTDFFMTFGSGYLYAHNPDITLRINGVLNNGNYAQTIDLSYASSEETLKGFNLMGNPIAHDISYTKTESVSDGYYYIDYGNAWCYTTSTNVPAGRGFLVKANAANQSVSLNPQNRGTHSNIDQYLSLSIGDEKVYVKLNEGVSMPLVDLNGKHSPFYLVHESQPYIMLVRDGAASLDLCYEAGRSEQQTIMAQTEDISLDYLHLIDHLTGANIDLLQTPEYTFTSSPTDYTNRFKLIFNADSVYGDTDDDAFAYYNGSEWVITEGHAGAILQIVDVMV